MRLTEAIRLGAMLKPQAFGELREDWKSCALGAACDAVGIKVDDDTDDAYHALLIRYRFLHAEGQCPACWFLQGHWRRWKGEEYDVEDVIIHLNDDHQWTRERIADWVATVEPASSDAVDPQAGSTGMRSTRVKESAFTDSVNP